MELVLVDPDLLKTAQQAVQAERLLQRNQLVEFVGAHGTGDGPQPQLVAGPRMPSAEPGSLQGLHLVVTDIEAARADLVDRGVDQSGAQRYCPACRERRTPPGMAIFVGGRR